MTELKPCPFCGSDAVFYESHFKGDSYQISCPECSGEDSETGAVWKNGKTFDEAAERWNKRATPPGEGP